VLIQIFYGRKAYIRVSKANYNEQKKILFKIFINLFFYITTTIVAATFYSLAQLNPVQLSNPGFTEYYFTPVLLLAISGLITIFVYWKNVGKLLSTFKCKTEGNQDDQAETNIL